MHRYTLQKYNGPASRHTCPSCGGKKSFVRYISEYGNDLADHVGRCNRESNCGHHFKPKDYFADNPHLSTGNGLPSIFGAKPAIPKQASINKNVSQSNHEGRFSCKKIDFIENDRLLNSLGNYGRNAFVQFLLGLFPNDAQDVWQAVKEYLIGTDSDGKTIFWQIDQKHRIRTGKSFAYDRLTGKRIKRINPYFLHPKGFNLEQCFYGEHLLTKYPGRPLAFVESEKTAILGSICKCVFPDLVWLACGGKSNFNAESLDRIGRDRTILIFPDADGYQKWRDIASDATKSGLVVEVSDLIEKLATDAEKDEGYDLADYLIALQSRRNDPDLRQVSKN